MRINNGGPDANRDAIVFFPVDDHSIPFQHAVKLNLRGKHLVHAPWPEEASDGPRVTGLAA
ncbi:MAG: hypothetical protein OXH68_09030 [Gammaproteobacteria bacterium]|nr:hypothetical protein [Gammaproteobacteria bacterium]